MNSEHPEYNRDTNPYPSFGKKYNSERGIISLTSWKARINTVSKTLYSLLTQCKGFHIVLVLSEEEFPKMMDELPENLKLFVENDLIEILFVYKNYKSFKKVLFTMDKYRDVPVISADDDCIYGCNYAQMLYDRWKKEKIKIFYCSPGDGSGWGYIWPPHIYKNNTLKYVNVLSKISNNDDLFYVKIADKMKLIRVCINVKSIAQCHNTIGAINMGKIYRENKNFRSQENKKFDLILEQ